MRALLAILVLVLASACDLSTAPESRDQNCEQYPDVASRGYVTDGLRDCYY